jgi:4-amino-4-deoxy-L-arabinose transferase-like glycosyltransferase
VVRGLATGGAWLVPVRDNGKLTRKPPLYYWLGAASWTLLPGRPEAAVRLPSIAGGTIGVLATYGTASLAFGPQAALPAAIVLATSFEWLRASTRARIDMTLAAPLALLLLAWVGALGGRRRWPLPVATAALTLAVLAKGPVALVLASGAAGVTWWLHRHDVRLRVFAVPIALAGVLGAVWYAAAWLRHGETFATIVLAENVGRFLDAGEENAGHEHGVAYLLVLGLVGLLPWVPLLPLAAGPARDLRRSAAATLLVAWPAIVLAFFALSSGKRGVYLLPAQPALAVLIGAGTARVVSGASGAARWLTLVYAPALFVLCLFAALTAAGFAWSPVTGTLLTDRDHELFGSFAARAAAHRGGVALMALAALAAAAGVAHLRRRGSWRGMVLVVGTLMVALTATFQTAMHPAVGRAESLAGFLQELAPMLKGASVVYAARPVDPEVGYYAPLPVEPWPRDGLAQPAWLLTWKAQLGEWTDAAGKPLLPAAESEVERGSNGTLVLLRIPPSARRRRPARPGAPASPQNG